MLTAAVQSALARATLVGWRLGARRQVTVDPAAGKTTIRLSWRNDAGITEVRHGDVEGLDLRRLPNGIQVLAWEAPPDDVITLQGAATDEDIRSLNAMIGGGPIDKGTLPDGGTIYWLRGLE